MGKGKKTKKFIQFDVNKLPSPPSQSSTSKQASRKSNKKTSNTIKSGNTDSTSVEEQSVTATTDILESSGDISRISDTTKDESTDVSSRLDESALDESPTGKDNKQDSSNSCGSEINCGNYEPESVKNGIQNLSVNSQPGEYLHKNNTEFENRGRNNQYKNDRKSFTNENRKGGKGARKQQYSSNFQHETSGRNITLAGDSQGELEDHSTNASITKFHVDHWQQKTWGRGDGKSIQKPKERISRDYNNTANSYTKPLVHGDDESYRQNKPYGKIKDNNTCQFADKFDRRNETTNQGNSYKGKGAGYKKSNPINELSNFETQPKAPEIQKSRNAVSVNYVDAHKTENSEQNVLIDSENWDDECRDYESLNIQQDLAGEDEDSKQNVAIEKENLDDKCRDYGNLNNPQDLVGEETSNPAADKWDDENTENDSLNYSTSTVTDKYENKGAQKSNNNNWRRDGNKSFPTMSIHHQGPSNRYSEGSKDHWNKSNNRYLESTDKELKAFYDEEKKNKNIEFVKVEEIQQDLFAMSKDYSLGHCVAEDMRMGSGIAVNFKREFKQLGELFDQRQKQGGLAVVKDESKEGTRYIYYLVTKRESTGKPTYEKFWSSLQKMRDHVRDNGVEKLAIPRLGCGLDRLEWHRVKHMIEFLFKEVDVKITVCNFQQTEELFERQHNHTCKVVNVKKSIVDIEEYTTIIYLSSVDGHVSEEMEQLDKKFHFLNEFKNVRKQLGDIVKYECRNQVYTLYGCIVKKSNKDVFQFKSFAKCVLEINKNNRKDKYEYVGLQAINDDTDDLLMEKILTILKNYLVKVDIYVCWHGDLVRQMPVSYRESI